MLSVCLALALATAPTPRILPDSDVTVFAPKLGRLSTLQGFLTRAGEHSALFRPSSYTGDFLPLLGLDPFSAKSLEGAGLDLTSDATMNLRGDTHLTCVMLADAPLFESRVDGALARLGTPTSQKLEGVRVRFAKGESNMPAASLRLGREVCVVSGTSLLERDLTGFARWMNRPRLPPPVSSQGLNGVAFLWMGRNVVGLDGKTDTLKVDGRSEASRYRPVLVAPEPVATASVLPSGVAWVRARAQPSALAGNLRTVIERLVGGRGEPRWEEFFAKLTPFLTGELLTRVDRIHAEQPLAEFQGRFFAFKEATLLEVKDPAAVEALVKSLVPGGRLVVGPNRLEVGVKGSYLYAASTDAALAAITPVFAAKPQKPAHALEGTLEGPAVARALAEVSLLDVIGDKQLMAAFLASGELGPLLQATRSLSFWADTAGPALHFHLVWGLSPPRR